MSFLGSLFGWSNASVLDQPFLGQQPLSMEPLENRLVLNGSPEIALFNVADNTEINDYDDIDFGSQFAGQSSTQTFEIRNLGDDTLNVEEIDGSYLPAGFSLTQQIDDTSLAPGETTQFEITFDSQSPGYIYGGLTINSNDADEGSFGMNMSGEAVNNPPTTLGFDDVSVLEDSTDLFIPVWDQFDDVEDGAQGLSYAVVNNTNAPLFDYVDVTSSELFVDFAENAFGEADVTIRATDLMGESVETTVHFDVEAVNDPPTISWFEAVQATNGKWTLQGDINDVDSPVEGQTITFFHHYNGTLTTGAGGNFYIDGITFNDPGWVWMKTTDSSGAESDPDWEYIA